MSKKSKLNFVKGNTDNNGIKISLKLQKMKRQQKMCPCGKINIVTNVRETKVLKIIQGRTD